MPKSTGWKKVITAGAFLGGLYGFLQSVAKHRAESKHIDDGNPYIDAQVDIDCVKEQTVYGERVKFALDKVLSFTGLVLFAPLYIGIATVVYLDDPGPVFFMQVRVGKDKKFFQLHKFRTMQLSTPHDVPTHQLENPEQYITKVGKVLRKYSLDELPQIWDIFRGKMSVIGPRPALWNQDDLVAERDKYDANSVMPGLTGWAQINGRDELEIPDKAKLDGEYVKHLKRGGLGALVFDARCFLGTIRLALCGAGVVEGGTGKLKKNPQRTI